MNKVVCAFIFLFQLSSARAFTPPDFTSNVYDATATLSSDNIKLLHKTIQELHDSDDVWPAVAVVSSLDGESIEQCFQ